MARKKPPAGLKGPGRALWRSILADLDDGWELDARELDLLRRACRCADELAKLEAEIDRAGVVVEGSHGQARTNPAIAEARQLRLVLLRCLSAIELDDPTEAARSSTPAEARARKAANARWSRVAELERRRAASRG